MSRHWAKALGEAIREWRLREVGKQKAASELLSVNQSAISRWESGDNGPDFVALWRAGASIDALFTRAEQIENEQIASVECRLLMQKLQGRPDLLGKVQEIVAADERARGVPSDDKSCG